jgi:N-acylglucosamine 2-epimerase
MSPNTARLRTVREQIRTNLDESVLPFWMKHSPDREFGGYFNCLDRDGSVYDTKKHAWLQGREVWMFSRLHNARHPGEASSPYLDMARLGMGFLRKHLQRPDGRCYFSLARDGKPVFIQRKPFSECFYVMALAEYARATGDEEARRLAHDLFAKIVHWMRNPAELGRPVLEGATPQSDLAVPMILLNLLLEIREPGSTQYEDIAKECVARIRHHVRPELKLVLEHVAPDGSLIDSPEGRVVNPGHAIEAGWFLLNYARQLKSDELATMALNMIDWSFDYGWDKEYGGILYYLDCKGYSPIPLEWYMKLWWPHCEAMVAYALAYRHTREEKWWDKFEIVFDWTWSHFPDPDHGEWYGYLNRRGEVTHRFKGGPYKGCFHVPRALFLCDEILGETIAGT